VKEKLRQKPHYIKNNDYVDRLYRKIKEDPKPRKTVRSIQVSDIHIDFQYEIGSPNECDFPICCRNNHGPSSEEATALAEQAGFWGDYRCDLPPHTMKSMFDFIGNNVEELEIDFITWLGDNGAHSLWEYSKEEVAEYTRNITVTLKEALKDHPRVEVYPVVGNHDTWPVNTEDFRRPNIDWNINHLKEIW